MNVEIALGYIARGWAVLPCHGKQPLNQHGSNGATKDPEVVREWARRWPTANIGIATGAASGIYVVDEDSGGAETIAGLALPPTLTVRSGGGGRHFYFKRPAGEKWPNTAGGAGKGLGVGVDTRGDGGYVVAPPSIHPVTKEPYAWLVELAELAELPENVRLRVLAPKPRKSPPAMNPPRIPRGQGYANAALAKECEAVVHAPEGQRNHTLNVAAFSLGQLVGAGHLVESEVWARLTEAARAAGLEDREIEQTLNSGMKAGMSEPRVIPERPEPTPRQAPRARETAGPAEPARDGDIIPLIVISTREKEVTDAAAAALGAAAAEVFSRAGLLVEVMQGSSFAGGHECAAHIRKMPRSIIRIRMAASAAWVHESADKETGEPIYKPAHPPVWCVDSVAELGIWPGMRPLAGIIEAPVLRPDGSLLSEPGYDVATGLVLRTGSVCAPIPDAPTIEDATTARDRIIAIVGDVPFKAPEHRAAWVAALLTPFARYAFDAPAPLNLVTANARGTGKGLLCDIIGLVYSGRTMAAMPSTTDDEEMRKKITSIAMSGTTLVLLDNVKDRLGTSSLDAALTTTTWRDRLLGTNETVTLPLHATWFATGNNTALEGDLARRTLHICLETPHEKPEERVDLQHADLRAWVLEQRPQLVADVLTILRAYCVAGRPDMKLPPWGSFEGWGRLIQHAVVWVGLPDPGLTRAELQEEADTETQAIRGLLAGWREIDPKGLGLTAREVVRRVSTDTGDRSDGLRTALEELTRHRPGQPLDALRVSGALRRVKGRIVDGMRMMDVGKNNHDNAKLWAAREPPSSTNPAQTPQKPRKNEWRSDATEEPVSSVASVAGFISTPKENVDIDIDMHTAEGKSETGSEGKRPRNPAYPANSDDRPPTGPTYAQVCPLCVPNQGCILCGPPKDTKWQ